MPRTARAVVTSQAREHGLAGEPGPLCARRLPRSRRVRAHATPSPTPRTSRQPQSAQGPRIGTGPRRVVLPGRGAATKRTPIPAPPRSPGTRSIRRAGRRHHLAASDPTRPRPPDRARPPQDRPRQVSSRGKSSTPDMLARRRAQARQRAGRRSPPGLGRLPRVGGTQSAAPHQRNRSPRTTSGTRTIHILRRDEST